MERWVSILIAVLSSGAVSALITGIFTERAARKRIETGTQAGVRMLLYIWVKRLGKEYIEKNSVTFDELEDLKAMHKIYHDDLGGNGFLDTIMKQVESLNVR